MFPYYILCAILITVILLSSKMSSSIFVGAKLLIILYMDKFLGQKMLCSTSCFDVNQTFGESSSTDNDVIGSFCNL